MKRVDFASEALDRCIAEAAEAMLASLPEPGDCRHEFSAAFEAGMEPLLTKARRRSFWQRLARSAAAVLAAVLLGSGVFLSFNGEARAEFFSWVRELYESSIVYRFLDPYDPEAVLPEVEFGWLPEGYAEAVSDGDETMRIFVFEYRDEEKKPFIFEYYVMNSGTKSTLAFDEGYQHEDTYVNGYPGDWYLSASSTDSNELIWFDEENNTMFRLSAYLCESVMLHIAESIILTE